MKPPIGKSRWLQIIHGQLSGKQSIQTSYTRLWVIYIVFFLLFAALVIRLISVAAFVNDDSQETSVSNSEDTTFRRREIVDRNGELIAINLATASLYADPRYILDAAEAAKKLHRILPEIPEKELLEKFTSDKHFIWIKRNLTPKEQYAINSLGIPGLKFQGEEKRIYPKGSLFAHALGYVGLDGFGLAGMEKKLDKELTDSKKLDEPLQVSLDVRIQGILHEELSHYKNEFEATGAVGVVMDVNTGEVLAMVSLPDFDPQDPGHATSDQLFNRVTLGVFEMGSTFKIFTTAMALDTGAVSIRGGYDVSKPIRVGRFAIHDYHPKAGWLSVPEILIYSSNIGTAKMAIDVGSDVQQYFLKELGMLSQSPIELPEKGTPIYPSKWSEASMMTVSYGHGIAVTPMHVVSGVSAMVNGGTLYNATLLKHKKGYISKASIISAKTSRLMRQLLRMVVEDGTGSKADAEGYMVGGKTGTAEKVGDSGRYKKKALVSSFIGVFPIQKPRYVVLAMLDEPKGDKSTGYYATGGQVAAPVVKNVVSRIAPILGVMPVDKNSEEIRRHFWVELKADGKDVATY